MNKSLYLLWVCVVLLLVVSPDLAAENRLTGDASRAEKARGATLILSQDEALATLSGAPFSDQLAAVEQARALLYRGDCEQAVAILNRPDLALSKEALVLGAVSRGCEKATAGAVISEDPASGLWVRMQDDADVALVPYLAEVTREMRQVFEKQLGVRMPTPLRLELVRDQFALAAMTGLPLEAARTTGTIGVAKWGRVIMVSPRATEKGYPAFDTFAHELVHLALTRGSGDRAPLWLQEGVARDFETDWRAQNPFDDKPDADDLALFGIRRKMGPEIDKIGPSIALLPSAEEAHVTYAKVQSFMRFYGKQAGENAMPKLLSELDKAGSADAIDKAVENASGIAFGVWSTRWKEHLEKNGRELAASHRPGEPPASGLGDVQKNVRLSELLTGRGHHRAAEKRLTVAHEKMPREPLVAALLARAELSQNKREAAKARLLDPAKVDSSEGRWWSMRAALGIEEETSSKSGLLVSPYDPAVACQELLVPELPADPQRARLCQMARDRPRGR